MQDISIVKQKVSSFDDPKFLYKFRNFNNLEIAKSWLNGEIYLSSLAKLNDPYDTKAFLDYYAGTDADVIEYLGKANLDQTVADPQLGWKALSSYIKEGEITKIREMFNETKPNDEFLEKKMGVSSFSREQNLLLWAFYSENHTGFCVDYEFLKLLSEIDNIPSHDGSDLPVTLAPIQYSETMPIINPYKVFDDDQLVEKQFLTKSNVWSSEKEYRIITPRCTDTVVGLSSGIINGVYLGLDISDKNKEFVIDQLQEQSKKTKLYKCVIKDDEYGLDFEEIAY